MDRTARRVTVNRRTKSARCCRHHWSVLVEQRHIDFVDYYAECDRCGKRYFIREDPSVDYYRERRDQLRQQFEIHRVE